jgi:uncharacterized protein (DUF2141 family)
MRSLVGLRFGTSALCALAIAAGTAAFLGGARAQESEEEIVFVVHGLRANTGAVRGRLFSSRETWAQAGREVASCVGRPTRGSARCVVRPPGPGRYAFAFFHDADGDREIDRDLVGIPQEGYGFSNDARPGMGPPAYESASFEVAPGQTVRMRCRTLYGWSP